MSERPRLGERGHPTVVAAAKSAGQITASERRERRELHRLVLRSRSRSSPPAPFERGNEAAVTHGATAVVKLAPRAAEIADEIRTLMPVRDQADEPSVRLLALTLAQVEAGYAYVAGVGLVDEDGNARPVLRHLGQMINTAARLCDRLGLSPLGRSELGLNVARAKGEALRAHLAERYGSEEKT